MRDLGPSETKLTPTLFPTRHPGIFSCIINFYRTGRLHIMEDICVLDYSQDLEYWGVDTIWLETCCETKFSARKQFIKDTSRKEKAYQDACKVRARDSTEVR